MSPHSEATVALQALKEAQTMATDDAQFLRRLREEQESAQVIEVGKK